MADSSIPLSALVTVLIALAALGLIFWILNAANILKININLEAAALKSNPFFYEETWANNLFIAGKGLFPDQLSNYWPSEDCKFKIKSKEDVLENQDKIELCRHEVALALELWKITTSNEEVNLSYMKDYGIPRIDYLEEKVKEAREEMKRSAPEAARIIKEAAAEVGREWVMEWK